jgi:hypothetical protein
VLGALLGAGACFAGLLVTPPQYRAMVGLGEAKSTSAGAGGTTGTGTGDGAGAGAVAGTGAGAGTAAKRTFKDWLGHLQRGELAEAKEAGIEGEPEQGKPEQLEARGEYRWLSYFQQQRQAGQRLNPGDPAVQQAIKDLMAANTADAVFWLGHIQEMTGQLDLARKTYQQGAEKFKDDADQRQRFESALYRLELRDEAAPPAGAWRGQPGVGALAALLVALQQPGPTPPGATPPGAAPPRAATEEAGFLFWQALRQARAGDYEQAVKTLDQARQAHDQRRFTTRFRKSQNPFSDPDEDIFLRSADQIKAYWELKAQLQSAAGSLNLANRKDPAKVVNELLTRAKEGPKGGAGDAAVKALADKLKTEPQDLGKAVDQLLADRQRAQDEAARERDAAEKARKEAGDQKARLDTLNDKAAEAQAQARKEADRAARLEKELTRAQQEIAAADKARPDAGEITRLRKQAQDEADARKKAEDEAAAAQKKAQDEVAAARKKAEDEAAARKKAEDEIAAAQKRAGDEAAARKKAEDEAAAAQKRAQEAIAAATDKARPDTKEISRLREEAETARKKAGDEAAARKKAQDEAAAALEKARAEADQNNQLRAEADAARKRAQDEILAARRKAQEQIAAAVEKARAEAAAGRGSQQESGTRPEAQTGSNPLEADRHYAAGLNLYFERRYDAAEREFQAALDNDNRDARYFYFLGLARLAQGKSDAYGDFDQGARLEKQGLPSRPAVSTSLERVQGPVRQTLDGARDRAR